MGTKRKAESASVKLDSKKKRSKQKKAGGIIQKPNVYEPISEPKHDDIVLEISLDGEGTKVDSDASDNIVIVSDGEEDEDAFKDAPRNDTGGFNELAKNHDFIEFGFSSSDNDDAQNEYSDDGVISDDELGHVHRQAAPSSLYPWIKDHDHLKQKEIADWLTMEMKDFVNYISPSKGEIVARNGVVKLLKKNIHKFWPDAEAHVFGSCATDLYLPGSDIDMVVVSTDGLYEHRSRLYQLSSFLRTNQLAKNIEVIAKAKVPIIKFVDPVTNIHIDISFERTNGIIAAKKIRRWLDDTPGLRELVLIVKQFLRSRRLNNVHVGGLGGYATIILCYHFLKMHPRLATHQMSVLDNLGALLIEFFELYGRNFSYDNLIIAIDSDTDMPKYLLKRRHPTLNTGRNPFSIVIQDPSDHDNNITRSSYNLRDLKKAFGGAYQILVDKCYELNGASYKKRLGSLILGDIIKLKGKERDFNDDRHMVINHALVNHEDDDDDESDGANGNDKYYFSDMTVESESEVLKETSQPKVVRLRGNDGKQPAKKQKASDLFGVGHESDDDVVVLSEKNVGGSDSEGDEMPKRPKSNLDKDVRRDYWRQKGLEL